MMSVGIIENIPLRQGGTRLDGHQNHSNKAHRVCSRNTENVRMELEHEMANYQEKRYVIMNFFHDEKHIVYKDIGKGRRKKEVHDGVEVIIAIANQFNSRK